MIIKDGIKMLFQGDSITDCGRDRGDFYGHSGYVKLINGYIKAFYPILNVEIMNRGISGDTTGGLLKRIKEDVYDLKPDLVSIMIGVNDSWRVLQRNEYTPPEVFERNYRGIIEGIKKNLNCPIVIIEPYLLESFGGDKERFRSDLNPKTDIIRRLVIEYGLEFIPLNGIFAEASSEISPSLLAADGVHPDPMGYSVIAREWIKRARFVL